MPGEETGLWAKDDRDLPQYSHRERMRTKGERDIRRGT